MWSTTASGSWPSRTSADADDGPGPAAATHAVNRDADAAVDVREHVVGRAFHQRALAVGIDGWASAHEILQADRGDRAR